jgi:hypothetical protein
MLSDGGEMAARLCHGRKPYLYPRRLYKLLFQLLAESNKHAAGKSHNADWSPIKEND